MSFSFFVITLFSINVVNVFSGAYVCLPHACNTHISQKKVMDSLELEFRQLQNTMWILGTESGSSGKIASVFNE